MTFPPALETLPSPGSNCCSAAKVRNRSRPTLGQAGLTGMSQLQYHCPASPMAAAPAPLPLGQPQPGYSIHCGSGTLPSESAGQPVRSSALPAGSATPYTTTTGYVVFIVFIGKKYCFCLETLQPLMLPLVISFASPLPFIVHLRSDFIRRAVLFVCSHGMTLWTNK